MMPSTCFSEVSIQPMVGKEVCGAVPLIVGNRWEPQVRHCSKEAGYCKVLSQEWLSVVYVTL